VCNQFEVLKPIINIITRTVMVIDTEGNLVYREAGAPALEDVVVFLKEKGVIK
jgi:peroxiredoxin